MPLTANMLFSPAWQNACCTKIEGKRSNRAAYLTFPVRTPPSGTVPLGVWKLPRTAGVDVSCNLLTRFTGENRSHPFDKGRGEAIECTSCHDMGEYCFVSAGEGCRRHGLTLSYRGHEDGEISGIAGKSSNTSATSSVLTPHR